MDPDPYPGPGPRQTWALKNLTQEKPGRQLDAK